MVSSWQRGRPETRSRNAAKATGVYLNSMLARTRRAAVGYDEAIMLTDHGFIADGPGGRRSLLSRVAKCSPPTRSASIRPGINSATRILIQILRRSRSSATPWSRGA